MTERKRTGTVIAKTEHVVVPLEPPPEEPSETSWQRLVRSWGYLSPYQQDMLADMALEFMERNEPA